MSDDVKTYSFRDFVKSTEGRLRQALTVSVGSELAVEATAEALAYGWEHWDRIGKLENPAGYLYRVGRNLAKRMHSRLPMFAPVAPVGEVWVEPGLPAALASLPEKQRIVVGLVAGYGWSLGEAAGVLGVSKGTVQTHMNRGLDRLRRELGVEL